MRLLPLAARKPLCKYLEAHPGDAVRAKLVCFEEWAVDNDYIWFDISSWPATKWVLERLSIACVNSPELLIMRSGTASIQPVEVFWSSSLFACQSRYFDWEARAIADHPINRRAEYERNTFAAIGPAQVECWRPDELPSQILNGVDSIVFRPDMFIWTPVSYTSGVKAAKWISSYT